MSGTESLLFLSFRITTASHFPHPPLHWLGGMVAWPATLTLVGLGWGWIKGSCGGIGGRNLISRSSFHLKIFHRNIMHINIIHIKWMSWIRVSRFRISIVVELTFLCSSLLLFPIYMAVLLPCQAIGLTCCPYWLSLFFRSYMEFSPWRKSREGTCRGLGGEEMKEHRCAEKRYRSFILEACLCHSIAQPCLISPWLALCRVCPEQCSMEPQKNKIQIIEL